LLFWALGPSEEADFPGGGSVGDGPEAVAIALVPMVVAMTVEVTTTVQPTRPRCEEVT
jgi:formiminotetrahydrofolate cyclodeaminase